MSNSAKLNKLLKVKKIEEQKRKIELSRLKREMDERDREIKETREYMKSSVFFTDKSKKGKHFSPHLDFISHGMSKIKNNERKKNILKQSHKKEEDGFF